MTGETAELPAREEVCAIIRTEFANRVERYLAIWSELKQTLRSQATVPPAINAEIRNAMTHFGRALDPDKAGDVAQELVNARWHLRNASGLLLYECADMAREAVTLLHYHASLSNTLSPADAEAEERTLDGLWRHGADLEADFSGFASRTPTLGDRVRQSAILARQRELPSDYLELFERMRARGRPRELSEIRGIMERLRPDWLADEGIAAAMPRLTWTWNRALKAFAFAGVGVAILALGMGVMFGSAAQAFAHGWLALLIGCLAGSPVAIAMGFRKHEP